MKNRKKLIILIISLLFSSLYAQEINSEQDAPENFQITTEENKITAENIESEESQPVVPEKSKARKVMEAIDVILQFEPILYISPESKKNNSNVVNIYYAFTFGASFPREFLVSFQPTVSFFQMPNAWFGNMAIPTEIENRTTTTLSFMLNLPAAFNFKFKKSRLQLSVGAGALLRTGLLSPGVKENDTGYLGTAAEDVKAINKWFWDDGRWLYGTVGVSWLYNVTSKIKIGPVLNAYIPIKSFMEYKKPQDMIISLGVRICR